MGTMVMELDLIEIKFSFSGGGFGQKIITFGVNMGSSIHVDKKKMIT